MKTIQELRAIVEKLIENTDLFLVDLLLSKDSRIDLFIDAPQGVDIGKCIGLNRQLNDIFDKDGDNYALTVSSAGIGYPFKVPGQYYKNIGKPVEVIQEGDSGKWQGTLKAFDGETITVEYQEKVLVEGKKRKELVTREKSIPLGRIKQIKTVIAFKQN